MSRSPVNRRDPSGTKRIEKDEIERQHFIIGQYMEAMREQIREHPLDKERNQEVCGRLVDAMSRDIEGATDDWIHNAEQAAIKNTDRVFKNLRVDIKLADQSYLTPGEAAELRRSVVNSVTRFDRPTAEIVADIIADGYLEGEGSDEITRRICNRFDDTEGDLKTNAERAVRTETMKICDKVNLARYEAAGVTRFYSYPTADDRCCPECISNATNGQPGGKLYLYTAGELTLPWHPNCRCCRLPYIEGDEVLTI